MANVVTKFDVDLAAWKARIEEVKLDQQKLKAQARDVKLGSGMVEDNGVLAKFSGHIGEMKSQLVGLATAYAGVEGLKALWEIANAFGDLADKSASLGELPGVISKVGQAASEAGTDLETVEKAMLKAELNLSDMGEAGDKARAALAALGIDAGSFVKMGLDEKLAALSNGFVKAQEDGGGLHQVFDLVGKSALKLIPLLSAGGDELENVFGNVKGASQTAVVVLDSLTDKTSRFAANIKTDLGNGMAGIALTVNQLNAGLDGLLNGKGFSAGAAEYTNQMFEQVKAQRQKIESMREANRVAESDGDKAKKSTEAQKQQAEAAAKELQLRQQLAALKSQVSDAKMAGLPDEQKLEALEAKLKEIYGGLRVTEQTPASLEFLAKDREKKGDTAGTVAYNEALAAVLKISAEQDRITAAIHKRAADGSSARADDEAKGKRLADEVQTQTQIDRLKAASGGRDTVEIQRLEDKNKAHRLALTYQDQFNIKAATALSIATGQVAAQRAAANAGANKQKGNDAADLKDEMEILKARAGHQNHKADRLEKASKVRKEARDLQNRLGLDPDAAHNIAQTKADLEDKINGKGSHKIHGGVSKNVDAMEEFKKRNPHLHTGPSATAQLKGHNAANAARAAAKSTTAVDGFDKAVQTLDEMLAELKTLNDG